MKDKRNIRATDVLIALLVLLFGAFLLSQYVFHRNLIGTLVTAMERAGLHRVALTPEAGYGAVFLFGLLSSLHCAGMCGGIAISVSGSAKRYLFHVGRCISYTVVGAFLGGIGTVISATVGQQKWVPLVCGIAMMIMSLLWFLNGIGIQMPIRYERFASFFKGRGPFLMGLLLGFMPCATLQMAELYALGTGNVLQGAVSMFCFSIASLPALLILTAAGATAVSVKWKWVQPLSSIIMMLMGTAMVIRYVG